MVSVPFKFLAVGILALFVVLIVAASYFSGYFSERRETLDLEQAFNGACTQLKLVWNCDIRMIENVTVQQPSAAGLVNYSLTQLCSQKLAKTGVNSSSPAFNTTCGRVCGCVSA